MDVAQRHPVQLAVVAVDHTAEGFQLLPDVGISVHTLTRWGRDLDQRGAAVVLGVVGQQFAERTHALGQAFGVVEPVDAQQQTAALVLLAYAVVHVHRVAGVGECGELVHVDADGESLRAHGSVKRAEVVRIQRFGTRFLAHVAREMVDIRLALKAHQVVRKK